MRDEITPFNNLWTKKSQGTGAAQDLNFIQFPKAVSAGDPHPHDHLVTRSGQVFQSLRYQTAKDQEKVPKVVPKLAHWNQQSVYYWYIDLCTILATHRVYCKRMKNSAKIVAIPKVSSVTMKM